MKQDELIYQLGADVEKLRLRNLEEAAALKGTMSAWLKCDANSAEAVPIPFALLEMAMKDFSDIVGETDAVLDAMHKAFLPTVEVRLFNVA